jgi:outer membrane protein OmpA-like peptidoglycan-associated protein
MNDARPVAILSAIIAAGLVSACASQRVRTPERPGQALAVLLPDADSKTVGRATVANTSGSATLDTARESTVVSAGEPPAPVTVLSESEVDRIFGDALNALPPAPQRFTLYFRFESDELTKESRALVPEILKAVRERPVPDLTIIGHTDTTGTAAANFALGRTRALMVRGLLVEAGADAAVVDIASHGESDLQVKTADGTLEPRNRRVEISVR